MGVMLKHFKLSFFFALLSLAILGHSTSFSPSSGELTLRSLDGQTREISKLAERPTVLLFLKSECPHNKTAIPRWNELFATAKSGVRIIGVLAEDAKVAREFIKAKQVKFPILLDPKSTVSQKMGVQHSLDHVLLMPGKATKPKLWAGDSQDYLRELLKIVNKSLKEPIKFDISKFPKSRQSGCSM